MHDKFEIPAQEYNTDQVLNPHSGSDVDCLSFSSKLLMSLMLLGLFDSNLATLILGSSRPLVSPSRAAGLIPAERTWFL